MKDSPVPRQGWSFRLSPIRPVGGWGLRRFPAIGPSLTASMSGMLQPLNFRQKAGNFDILRHDSSLITRPQSGDKPGCKHSMGICFSEDNAFGIKDSIK